MNFPEESFYGFAVMVALARREPARPAMVDEIAGSQDLPRSFVARILQHRASGKWRVVMLRPLRTANARDAQLEPGQESPVALAAWDGARHDRHGQKAASVWQRLSLEGGK